MKKLAIKLSLLFVPTGLIILFVNIKVDPANIFSEEKYVDSISSILVSGNNVDNISNYNERLLQKSLLFKKKVAPQIVVLGSSRIMEINSTFFSGKSLLNIGVSHANINDLLALAGILDSLQLVPQQQVIINVDPFLICKGEGGAGEWHSLLAFHQYFLQKNKNSSIGEQDHVRQWVKKDYTMLSFEYFQESLSFLIKGKSKEVYNIGKQQPTKYGRYADGSIAYPSAYTHPDTALTADVAKRMSKEVIGQIDPLKLEYLNCLIDFFKKKKVEILIVKLPFHPDFFSGVNQKQKNIFIKYETFFDDWAKQQQLNISGGFSAIKLHLTRNDFYDSYHCSASAIKKILQ